MMRPCFMLIIFFYLLLFFLLIRLFHWKFSFFYENHVLFVFVSFLAEMFFSFSAPPLQSIQINIRRHRPTFRIFVSTITIIVNILFLVKNLFLYNSQSMWIIFLWIIFFIIDYPQEFWYYWKEVVYNLFYFLNYSQSVDNPVNKL